MLLRPTTHGGALLLPPESPFSGTLKIVQK